jgi:hypothetical protein
VHEHRNEQQSHLVPIDQYDTYEYHRRDEEDDEPGLRHRGTIKRESPLRHLLPVLAAWAHSPIVYTACGLITLGVIVDLLTNWNGVKSASWTALSLLMLLVTAIVYGSMAGMVLLGLWITVNKIIKPFVEIFLMIGHGITDIAGKWRRHRVLAQAENYTLFEQPGGTAVFQQVSQDRTTYKIDVAKMQEQAQLPQRREPTQPQLRTIVEELHKNAWELVFGSATETGQLLKTTLPQAVHIQLLGASGQGKSREAQSILAQLSAKNDAEHLRLAFIDCEGETTAPFHRLPHVSHLAEDEREAAKVLAALCQELYRRDNLAATNKALLAALPVLLLFVEEFLNLRRTMREDLKEQALEDYTTLALRGRKRGMFLFAIGQTAYTEKAIRDAQLQFLSSMAFAIKPSAARSAGFTNTELLNKLYEEKRPGQFLLERPQGDDLVLAPYVDAAVVDSVLPGCHPVVDLAPTSGLQADDNQVHNQIDTALQAKVDRVVELLSSGAGKVDIIKDVWNVAPSGRSKAYEQAQAEYSAVMQQIMSRIKG